MLGGWAGFLAPPPTPNSRAVCWCATRTPAVSALSPPRQVLVMSFVGVEGNPAPQLGALDLTPRNAVAAYLQVRNRALRVQWSRGLLLAGALCAPCC